MSSATTFQTPILLILYNRPDATRGLLEILNEVQPTKIYVSSDGPASDNETDHQNVQAVRSVVNQFDLKKGHVFASQQHETNLGCKQAVASAIEWFFKHEEMGIILEDDCHPDMSFFPYCQSLLTKYKDDPQIGMISGRNNLGHMNWKESYHFSTGGSIWGWATWRRVVSKFRTDFPLFFDKELERHLVHKIKDRKESNYLAHMIRETVIENRIDTWDYQWGVYLKLNSLWAIVPKFNLISNTGFGSNSTHTLLANKSDMTSRSSISFPLIHPDSNEIDWDLSQLLARSSIPNARHIRSMVRRVPRLRNLIHLLINKTRSIFH